MFFSILRKDLKRKKSMNIILLLFITLCAMFTASSVSNLIVVTGAVEFYTEKSRLTDFFIFKSDNDTEQFEEWLSSLSYVDDFEKDIGIIVNDENFINDDYFTLMGVCALTTRPERYGFPLGDDNNPIPVLSGGEIALSRFDARRSELKIGDEITIRVGDRERTFTLTYTTKDIMYGSPYVDTKRLIISDEDYDYFMATSGEQPVLYLAYSISTAYPQTVHRELQKQGFIVQMTGDRAMIEQTLTLEMVLASLLVVIGVVLIIIAFAILRFTIVFTLQEDYREIGIMKAIGLKNSAIKNIYIVKYFAISLVAATGGTIISIPFGTMMLESVQDNMAIQSDGSMGINIICGVVIIGLVLIFCRLSSGSVDKFTAIQAIRGGSTGERFKKKRFFHLNRRKSIPTVFYMAFNSILSAAKSYTVLIITFVLGTLLIIMPLNALNTLKGDDVIYLFGVVKSDVYIVSPDTTVEADIKKAGELEQLYKENGIELELNTVLLIFPWLYTDDMDSGIQMLGLQSSVYETDMNKNYTGGTPPVLPNEIAVTNLAMDRLGVVIGDTVSVKIGTDISDYIITASMQSMNNMGISMLFSKAADIDAPHTSTMTLQGNFINRTGFETTEELIKQMTEITPDYQIKTAGQWLDQYIGSSIEIIEDMKFLVLFVVLFINGLITILLIRTFVTRERGEISLMKNIGFNNRFLKLWQIIRIIIVLFVSVTLGTLLSNPLNPVISRYTFGIMGAPQMPLNVVAFEVYFLYPMLLLFGTAAAAIFGSVAVNKIDFREINNVE